MLLPVLLTAALLSAAPGEPYDPFDDPPPGGAERSRLILTGWGGGFTGAPGSGRGAGSLAGGEVGWSFDAMDVSVQALSAQVREGRTGAAPLALLRLGQRFETRHGLEGIFTLGLGAARLDRWTGWFQIGIGGRVDLGPIFLAAEVGFEQSDLLRLAAGLGARF